MNARTGRRLVSLFLFAFTLAALAAAEPAETPAPDGPRVRSRRVRMIGPRRAYLGVSLLDATPALREHYGAPKDSGVIVSEVTPESPAARAGIAVGDVITAVDGQPVGSFWDVTEAMSDRRKGDKVEVDFVRDRASKKVSVTVDEMSAEPLLGKKENRFFLSGDDGTARTIVIGDEPVLAGEPMQRMESFFKSPEWKARLDDMSECDRVRKRLEAVEERLRAIEKKMPSK